jgi:hypothetical protein
MKGGTVVLLGARRINGVMLGKISYPRAKVDLSISSCSRNEKFVTKIEKSRGRQFSAIF